MSACEECWTAAYFPSRMTGRPQAEVYRELLAKNEAAHTHPVTPAPHPTTTGEQA